MPELNDAVIAAVARWREYREPCPGIEIEPGVFSGCYCTGDSCPADCPCCSDGINHPHCIQPAIVKALIEAVTKPCKDILDHAHHAPPFGCWGTGRLSRDWEEIGEGALRGRIEWVVYSLKSYNLINKYNAALVSSYDSPFTDKFTLAAVDEAVRQLFGGTK